MEKAVAAAAITIADEPSKPSMNDISSTTAATISKNQNDMKAAAASAANAKSAAVTTGPSASAPLSASANANANDKVRAIHISEYKAAALCLAEAFADDEVARYFVDVPDRESWTAEQRWNLHVKILEYITYAHCMRGLVTTVGEGYGAVALW